MKLQKILAGICTGALALSLSIPAFAAGVTNDTETTFSGSTLSGGTVAVTVPTATGTNKLYVNPYGMPYTLTDGTFQIAPAPSDGGSATNGTIKETTTTAGFFSNTAVIKNESTAKLKVSVTMTTTEAGAVKVVATDPTGTPPADNTLFGNFEIANATLTGTTLTPNWTGAKQVVIPAGSGTASTAGTSTTTDTQFSIPAATSTMNQGVTTITASYAVFRLTGKAFIGSTNNSWDDADLATVVVAFSFEPDTTAAGG